MKALYPVLLIYVVFTASSCNDADKQENFTAPAKIPVYATDTAWTKVEITTARQAENIGKITTYNNYIYLVDLNKGIHIIDNSNPSSPAKISFISIPLCTDIAIKNNVLYANNGSDMIVLNIANPQQPQLLKRIERVYSNSNEQFPPGYDGYFECVDDSKGRVIGWIDTTLQNPKCRK
jgi:hypothetical protein